MDCADASPRCSATRIWLQHKVERRAAETVIHHWRKRCHRAPHISETDFWTLLFSLIHTPAADADKVRHPCEQRLMAAPVQLIADFEECAAVTFADRDDLLRQLYTHLAQSLDRTHFTISIDNSVALDVSRLYPRLLRTTQLALRAFEYEYQIAFSPEEVSLITVIFGASLMQENALQEKQVRILTGEDPQLGAGCRAADP